MKKGYTLIELLVVIAVLIIILVFSATVFYNLTRKTDLDTSRDNIISTLNMARNKTLASEEAAKYGVYFDASSDPDKYILFKGVSTSFEEIHELPSTIRVSGIKQVVFEQLEGNTDDYGSVTIQSLVTDESRTIYIYPSGEVSTRPESVSGVGRITDSRHVHFDYNRNIDTATETITLTFADPVTIVNIPMDDYTTSVSFDWEDDIDVGGDIEDIRIHTHRLNNPDSQFCIHRDRRYDNKALTITIDGDTTGDLVSYTAEGLVTKGSSFNVGNPEAQ